MLSFEKIQARAAKRKGGVAALQALLPKRADLAALSDDRALAEMTRLIFKAGFVWRVIDQKWPDFEEAFLGFAPKRLAFEPDEFWEDLGGNKKIVRNGQKIMAVRHNAQFVIDIAGQHGSFRNFIDKWPANDLTGLWLYLAKHGKRLGGMTGRYFTRMIGKDCFIWSRDVVAALRDAGLEIAENPTSKGDAKRVEQQFNQWVEQTGLSRHHLSRILAMSIGENHDATTLNSRVGGRDDA